MIEHRSQQVIPPLLQLNISLNGGNSLTCQQCQPAAPAPENAGLVAGKTNANPRLTPRMPVPLVAQALRDAAPLGLQAVRLMGAGNPLAAEMEEAADDGERAMAALLDILAEQPVDVVLETSGEGITPSSAVRMARMPRFSASVGLDGADAAMHETIRGNGSGAAAVRGAFDAASSAAQMLAEQGVAVEIVFTVQRRNARQIPQVVRLAERLGAQALRFVFGRPEGGATGNGTTTGTAGPLAVEELIAIGRRVEREFSRGTRLRLLFDQPPAFRGFYPWARGEDSGRKEAGRIPAGRMLAGRCGSACAILNTLTILPGQESGVFALCGAGSVHARSAPALVLGRLGHDALEQVWREHPTLQMLRDGLPERLSGVCERCTVKSSCLGYCPTENYLRAGSFWSPYWFCEAADGVQLFPASRLVEI
jgi:SynChlorMet cassette radical SAM/SPASM protein ScmF